MNEPYRVEPLTADFQPPLAPLIDRAFDAWDGDVAALLGVPRGTFEPETEAVEPTEFCAAAEAPASGPGSPPIPPPRLAPSAFRGPARS